jgi:hypothetical protein
MQHRTAFLCDYVLELPLVPAVATSANLTKDSYDASTDVVTGAALGNLPVAKNTVRTPITFANGTETDAATVFVRQVDTLAEVTEAGTWYIDLTTGVISWFDAADPGAGNIYTITYYHYATAPASVSKFACVVGDVKPGDFLKCDANSNWTKATPHSFGADYAGALNNTDHVKLDFDDFSTIMGQVIEVEDFPRDLLDRVRTAYPSLSTDATGSLPGYAGQMDQMPGTANGGVSDKIHYAGAANKVVRVNLVSR